MIKLNMKIEDIKERLTLNFKNDKVEVFDTRGTGDHFSLVVISDKFIDSNTYTGPEALLKLSG